MTSKPALDLIAFAVNKAQGGSPTFVPSNYKSHGDLHDQAVKAANALTGAPSVPVTSFKPLNRNVLLTLANVVNVAAGSTVVTVANYKSDDSLAQAILTQMKALTSAPSQGLTRLA